MTASGMIGRLKALKKSVLADGQVDWDETERLLAVILLVIVSTFAVGRRVADSTAVPVPAAEEAPAAPDL